MMDEQTIGQPEDASAHTDGAPVPDAQPADGDGSGGAQQKPFASAAEWYRIGVSLRAQAHNDKAEFAFRKSIETDINFLDAYISLGLLLAETKRLGRAFNVFMRAKAIAPSDVRVLTNIGEVLRLLGRHHEAYAHIRRALQLSPSDVDAALVFAALHVATGQADRAVPIYAAVAPHRPDDLVVAINQANALRAIGDSKAALSVLKGARERGLDGQILRNGLVMCFADLGDVDRAIREGEDLLRMKDDQVLRAFSTRRGHELQLRPESVNRDGIDVIAIPLFGKHPTYTTGAIENAKLAGVLYPGWRCRFYCDETVPLAVRDRLGALGAEVVIVPSEWRRMHGAFWRFHVSDDPSVRRFICRDADNRFNRQERWAVERWIESGRLFHIMRDHPYHAELILAGMWGGHAGVLPPLDRLIAAFPPRQGDRWSDQLFLAQAVWPLIRNDALIHDSVWSLFGAQPFDPAFMLTRPDHVGNSLRIARQPPDQSRDNPNTPSKDR